MKRIFIILLALVLALSSCSPADTMQNSKNTSSESSQSESTAEREDIYAKKIARNRKKVYEMLASCDDILDTIPNPAKVDTIPTNEIYDQNGEPLPDCVADWANKYFSYMVTGKPYFDGINYEGDFISFLAAMRRINDEIADKIKISADSSIKDLQYLDESYSIMTLDVYFRCTPYKYSEEIKDYDIIPNSYETITVNFYLCKEDGEWVIENEKILYGNYYNYAVECKNKTWGRFPEVDRYDVLDYTICEYAERLYNFGVLPPY